MDDLPFDIHECSEWHDSFLRYGASFGIFSEWNILQEKDRWAVRRLKPGNVRGQIVGRFDTREEAQECLRAALKQQLDDLATRAASEPRQKPLDLGVRRGAKRRRAGGHGYSGGDGWVEID